MEKCIIYLRVSTKDQDPERYKKDCVNYAVSHGWEIVDIIMENISAYKDVTREGYEEVIERAKKGEFTHIVVWDMSRWSRKEPLEVAKEIRYLRETYGIKIHSVQEPILEFLNSDPNDVMSPIYQALQDLMTVLISWQNNLDSKRKSERIRLTYEKKKKLAGNLGKKVRWGRKSIKEKGIDPDAIIAEYNKPGASYRSVAKKFGISHQTVSNIIKEWRKMNEVQNKDG